MNAIAKNLFAKEWRDNRMLAYISGPLFLLIAIVTVAIYWNTHSYTSPSKDTLLPALPLLYLFLGSSAVLLAVKQFLQPNMKKEWEFFLHHPVDRTGFITSRIWIAVICLGLIGLCWTILYIIFCNFSCSFILPTNKASLGQGWLAVGWSIVFYFLICGTIYKKYIAFCPGLSFLYLFMLAITRTYSNMGDFYLLLTAAVLIIPWSYFSILDKMQIKTRNFQIHKILLFLQIVFFLTVFLNATLLRSKATLKIKKNYTVNKDVKQKSELLSRSLFKCNTNGDIYFVVTKPDSNGISRKRLYNKDLKLIKQVPQSEELNIPGQEIFIYVNCYSYLFGEWKLKTNNMYNEIVSVLNPPYKSGYNETEKWVILQDEGVLKGFYPDGKFICYLGKNGKAESAREAGSMGELINNLSYFDFNQSILVWGNKNNVYQIDFKSRTTRTIYSGPQTVTKVNKNYSQAIIKDGPTIQIRKNEPPVFHNLKDTDGNPISGYFRETKSGTYLIDTEKHFTYYTHNYPKTNVRFVIYKQLENETYKLLNKFEYKYVLPDEAYNRTEILAKNRRNYILSMCKPLSMFFIPESIEEHKSQFSEITNIVLKTSKMLLQPLSLKMALAGTLIMSILTLMHIRYMNYNRKKAILWICIILLFSFTGFICYFIYNLRTKPVCSHCKTKLGKQDVCTCHNELLILTNREEAI